MPSALLSAPLPRMRRTLDTHMRLSMGFGRMPLVSLAQAALQKGLEGPLLPLLHMRHQLCATRACLHAPRAPRAVTLPRAHPRATMGWACAKTSGGPDGAAVLILPLNTRCLNTRPLNTRCRAATYRLAPCSTRVLALAHAAEHLPHGHLAHGACARGRERRGGDIVRLMRRERGGGGPRGGGPR